MGDAGRRRLIYAGLLALQIGVALRFLLDRSPGTDAASVGLPLDDGWIHLVYARSLAAFDGFAYVPGQAEAGFTSPLWAMLLTPLFWLRLPWDVPLVTVVKGVGVGCSFAASVYGLRLGRRLGGLGAGLVLGAMIIVDPWLAFGAVSGMEVPLAAATSLAGFDFLIGKSYRPAGIAFALAVWSRPELVVIAALVIGSLAWAHRREGCTSKTVRDLGLPPAVAIVLWVGYCVVVTGRLLPTAFYLKHQDTGPLAAFGDLGTVFVDQLLDYPWMLLGSGIVAFAVGARRVLAIDPQDRDGRAARIALLVAGPLWIVAVTWAHRMNEPLAFYWHRYLDAGIALLFVPIAVGLWTCLEGLVRAVRRRPAMDRLDRPLAYAALPLVVLVLVSVPDKIERNAALAAWSAQNIQDEQVRVGVWIAQHGTPSDWVATHDAGAIRFVSDRPVVDMLGINTHQVLDVGLPAVLRAHPPSYLALIPAWYPGIASDPRLQELYRVRVDHFVICERCQQDTMVVLRP